jgi:hypothetical protein
MEVSEENAEDRMWLEVSLGSDCVSAEITAPCRPGLGLLFSSRLLCRATVKAMLGKVTLQKFRAPDLITPKANRRKEQGKVLAGSRGRAELQPPTRTPDNVGFPANTSDRLTRRLAGTGTCSSYRVTGAFRVSRMLWA